MRKERIAQSFTSAKDRVSMICPCLLPKWSSLDSSNMDFLHPSTPMQCISYRQNTYVQCTYHTDVTHIQAHYCNKLHTETHTHTNNHKQIYSMYIIYITSMMLQSCSYNKSINTTQSFTKCFIYINNSIYIYYIYIYHLQYHLLERLVRFGYLEYLVGMNRATAFSDHSKDPSAQPPCGTLLATGELPVLPGLLCEHRR